MLITARYAHADLVAHLTEWVGVPPGVEHLNEKYM
jgi:hypothetical protein